MPQGHVCLCMGRQEMKEFCEKCKRMPVDPEDEDDEGPWIKPDYPCNKYLPK